LFKTAKKSSASMDAVDADLFEEWLQDEAQQGQLTQERR
jgi:hypothetical protein